MLRFVPRNAHGTDADFQRLRFTAFGGRHAAVDARSAFPMPADACSRVIKTSRDSSPDSFRRLEMRTVHEEFGHLGLC